LFVLVAEKTDLLMQADFGHHQHNTLPRDDRNVRVFMDSRLDVIDTLFEFITVQALTKKDVAEFLIQYSEVCDQHESLTKPEISSVTYFSDKRVNALVKVALVFRVTLSEATELFNLVCQFEKQQSHSVQTLQRGQVDKVDSMTSMQVESKASVFALTANCSSSVMNSVLDESKGTDSNVNSTSSFQVIEIDLPSTENSPLLNSPASYKLNEQSELGISGHSLCTLKHVEDDLLLDELIEQSQVSEHQQKLPEECKSISLEQINDSDLIDSLIARGKRKIKVVGSNEKGLYLELSKFNLTIMVKCKYKGKGHRCVLFKWKHHEPPNKEVILRAVANYLSITEKLSRPPSSDEFRVETKVFKKVGDIIKIYLDYIVERYGDGSDEWKVVTGLINNHLSKPKEIQLTKHKQTMILLDENIQSFTTARFNCYLEAFKSTNGVHDKIVSRVKAAFNFAFDAGLISSEDARPFTRATRINSERHAVILGDDFKSILGMLNRTEQKDFVFFIDLQSTGHFRTQQLMLMKFEEFDFQHKQVRVKPKKGKLVDIQLDDETLELVKTRRKYLIAAHGVADYLFPSTRSSSGHRCNFYYDWDKICDELGWVETDMAGERTNKYRFHDYRDTLLDRISEFNDQVLASQIGHLSTHNVKNYRKASLRQGQMAAEAGNQRKPKL
jgi:integrase